MPPLALLTGVAYVCVAVLMTLLAIKLAPRRWGATSVVVGVLAVGGSYVAIRVGTETGFNEWLDHDVLEEIGGEVDDLSLWLIALGGALAVLAEGGSSGPPDEPPQARRAARRALDERDPERPPAHLELAHAPAEVAPARDLLRPPEVGHCHGEVGVLAG